MTEQETKAKWVDLELETLSVEKTLFGPNDTQGETFVTDQNFNFVRGNGS